MTEAINTTINFELVSPEARLMSGPVKMAVVPGEEGELGVGAGHASFIVSLKPGIVQLFSNDNEAPRKIFITGGFADITNTNCTVLAEQAIDVSSINASETEQEIRTLESNLASAQDPVVVARLNRNLVLAKAKLQAITGKIVL